MSLARDLHRGSDPATGVVSDWLRARGWSCMHAGRGSMWQHKRIGRGDFFDVMEATLRTIMVEQQEGQSLLGWFDADGELRAKPTRKQRLGTGPSGDEDLFR